MKPAPFAYRRPETLNEALQILSDYGDECRVIAGGQSLGAMLNMRLVTPRILLDLNHLDELRRISEGKQSLAIGAMVRQADAMKDRLAGQASLLHLALPHVGHFQTRNRGTIGGSVAHADPSAELPLALLVSGGSVELRSRRKTRVVKADDFFVSNLTTVRQPDELLTNLHWTRRATGTGEAFAEFAMRAGDFALVAAACRLTIREDNTIQDIRLGFTGVNERPVLVRTQAYRGQHGEPELFALIADAAASEIETVGDLHATARFRSNLVRELGKAVLSQSLESAGRVAR